MTTSNKDTMSKKQTPQTKLETKEKLRKLKQAEYRSFRLQKKVKADGPNVTGGFRLFLQSVGILKRHWKPFAGIAVVYALLNIALVQSFATLNISDTKMALENAFAGEWNQFLSGLSLFAYLVGSSTTTESQTAGAYQFILLLITSLALIWTLRQAYEGCTVRVRDAFYKSMYPLIPFVLVFGVVALQLLPMIFGTFLYGFVGSGGPVGGVELALWGTAIFVLTVLSLYMVCSSLFALYIVCLPDVTPMTALRSARALVRYRRWMVMRRVLFLPLILFLGGAVVMIPVIMFWTTAAIWIFFLLTIVALPLIHAYMYRLYRELL